MTVEVWATGCINLVCWLQMKQRYASKNPYGDWLAQQTVTLADIAASLPAPAPSSNGNGNGSHSAGGLQGILQPLKVCFPDTLNPCPLDSVACQLAHYGNLVQP